MRRRESTEMVYEILRKEIQSHVDKYQKDINIRDPVRRACKECDGFLGYTEKTLYRIYYEN